MSLLISESYINQTEGYRFGDVEPYEPWTQNIGRLFRTMQKEYGRCTGSVYVDVPGAAPKRIGWTFAKRLQYDDTQEYYVREVWITLHDATDTVTREHHYHVLNAEPAAPRVPADHPVRPLQAGSKAARQAKDLVTCGMCGRSWDDAVVTSMTPAPSARCPFEYFHGAA